MCQHGRTGYCHDDATPAERTAFANLYAHAFAWAAKLADVQRATLDDAEAYAGWFAARAYNDDDACVDHTSGWALFIAERVAA